MKTIAYLRVSTQEQDLDNQRLSILNFVNKNNWNVDEFVEIKISSRKSCKERRINEALDQLDQGDRLIVSELSRLGRSLAQIINIVNTLIKRKIEFTAVKENIYFNGKQDIQTKVMIAMFGLFSEIERDLISERTKQGLAVIKEKGMRLGRPKGSLGKSKLSGREKEINDLLLKKIPKSSIAKFMGVARSTLISFMKYRKMM